MCGPLFFSFLPATLPGGRIPRLFYSMAEENTTRLLSALKKISAARTLETLQAVAPQLEKLQESDQDAARQAYAAKLAQLPLLAVLERIAGAKTIEELKAVGPAARKLNAADKGIAKWSYEYARAQIQERT